MQNFNILKIKIQGLSSTLSTFKGLDLFFKNQAFSRIFQACREPRT